MLARPSDAVLLNNIVQNFGMLDLVKKVLASHKCQMDRSREQYARDLAGAPGAGPRHPVGAWQGGATVWEIRMEHVCCAQGGGQVPRWCPAHALSLHAYVQSSRARSSSAACLSQVPSLPLWAVCCFDLLFILVCP